MARKKGDRIVETGKPDALDRMYAFVKKLIERWRS